MTGFVCCATVGAQIANGRISDMAGLFGTSGGSITTQYGSAAADLSYSTSRMALYLGYGLKVSLPIPAEFHSGATYSWILPYPTELDVIWQVRQYWSMVDVVLFVQSIWPFH